MSLRDAMDYFLGIMISLYIVTLAGDAQSTPDRAGGLPRRLLHAQPMLATRFGGMLDALLRSQANVC